MNITIGAVLIVKNEEAVLERCLESVKTADEIVVCDTGSTDNTVAIARQFTDKVYTDYKWEDHFAKARNHAKSKSTTDWILSIDADEVILDFEGARRMAERGRLAVDIHLWAEDNRQHHWFPRLFRNIPQVWWESAAHNHLNAYGEHLCRHVQTDPVFGEVCGGVNIVYGYSPAHRLDPDRTLRILEKDLRDNPTHLRSMFYLSREYFYRGRYMECIGVLAPYVDNPGSRFMAEKAEAFMMMSRAFWALGKPDAARDACASALMLNANFKEACLHMAAMAGDGSENRRWQANADQWKRMAATATNDEVLFVRSC